MEFKKNEIELIKQTLAVPLMAFGYDKLINKIEKNQIAKVQSIFKELESSNFIDKKDLSFLAVVLLYSRDIIDCIEYHTLTGFTWEESTDLIVKILKNTDV